MTVHKSMQATNSRLALALLLVLAGGVLRTASQTQPSHVTPGTVAASTLR